MTDTKEEVRTIARILELNIPEENLEAVAANFDRLKKMAAFVGELELPPDTEIAPVFRP